MRIVQYSFFAIFSLVTMSQINCQTSSSGTFYNCELDIKVPLNPKSVQHEWKLRKNAITQRIGKITPTPSKESDTWTNTAQSVNELFQNALHTAPHFRQMCESIAKKAGCNAIFGKTAGLKKKSGIIQKVERIARHQKISKARAVSKINDSIRGTLIAKTPEQITQVVDAIKELTTTLKCKVVFHNNWQSERKSGYVGVHGTLFFPVYDHSGNQIENKNILTEIQIHLQCIMDGSDKCPKELAHRLYEKERVSQEDNTQLQNATMLIFLEGLRKCPNKQ